MKKSKEKGQDNAAQRRANDSKQSRPTGTGTASSQRRIGGIALTQRTTKKNKCYQSGKEGHIKIEYANCKNSSS
jgi:hypothetical protein